MKNRGGKYSTYFSSRGVSPEMYKNAKLPYYLLPVLGADKQLKILDIGCGFGQNLFAFKNAGFTNIHGIDISDEAIDWCTKNNLPVEQADVMQYEGERYDFVFMSHVLEHLSKDKIIPMLRKIREAILSEDGRLCIMVPNAMSNTDCYWAYEDFTHNTLFTPGSLLFVLREAGFRNIEFLDPDGLGASKGFKKFIKKCLLKLYIMNKDFWNKITGSAYHAPSPRIYTWEIKCIASAK